MTTTQRAQDVGDDWADRVRAVNEFDARLQALRDMHQHVLAAIPEDRRLEVGMACSVVDIAYRKLRPPMPADRNMHLVPADYTDTRRNYWGE